MGGRCSLVNHKVSISQNSIFALWYTGDLGAYTRKQKPPGGWRLKLRGSSFQLLSPDLNSSRKACSKLSLDSLNARSCDLGRAGAQSHWRSTPVPVSLLQRRFPRLHIGCGVALLTSHFSWIQTLCLQSVPWFPSCSFQLLRWEHYWPRLLKLAFVAGWTSDEAGRAFS